MKQMMNDEKLRNDYFDRVGIELEALDKNSSTFYQLVNEKIREVFEKGFIGKLQLIYDRSK